MALENVGTSTLALLVALVALLVVWKVLTLMGEKTGTEKNRRIGQSPMNLSFCGRPSRLDVIALRK